ncbi:MAG: hypothetical protein AAF513_20035, partial [Pseudomonadota bacterium]
MPQVVNEAARASGNALSEPLAFYLNGEVTTSPPMISSQDRGFMFGDGVYEAILVRERRLIAAAQHWSRLHKNLDALDFHQDLDLDALLVRLLPSLCGKAVDGRGPQKGGRRA